MSRTSAGSPRSRLTHLDARGAARMVDVSAKPATMRRAVARAVVRVSAPVLRALLAGRVAKGDALAVARLAGIQAAKDTARLIPLCHPLPLASVEVRLEKRGSDAIEITAETRCTAATGVEMEAMTAASVAALALYDMCKGMQRGITIERVELVHKSGGASGTWERARS